MSLVSMFRGRRGSQPETVVRSWAAPASATFRWPARSCERHAGAVPAGSVVAAAPGGT